MTAELERLQESAKQIALLIKNKPAIGIVLGSGLADVYQTIENKIRIPWTKISHFPQSSTDGHKSEWIFGSHQNKNILIQRGRVHYYEGHPMSKIVFSIRVMKLLGVQILILTNAAGAINKDFSVGDFVVLTDHINLIPESPLQGENIAELGPRFPDLSEIYSPRLRRILQTSAQKQKISLKEGVYLATPGPMFETPAEIRAFRILGADLVGMSTVPEAIAAHHAGMEVAVISCVTNMAAGVKEDVKLSHSDVIDVGKDRSKDLKKLIDGLLSQL